MNKQKAINFTIKAIVFILSISSAVTVFSIISYANYALFNDGIISKIFTYIGSIGLAMVVGFAVTTYISQFIASFRKQPTQNPLVMIRTMPSGYSPSGSNCSSTEPKPSYLIPIKSTNRR